MVVLLSAKIQKKSGLKPGFLQRVLKTTFTPECFIIYSADKGGTPE
jgi:hypothetical protein